MFLGSIPALVTPFRGDGIDEDAFRALIHEQIAAGVEGIVPCGSTGESATLSHEEHERVIRIAIEERRSLSPDALTGLEANLRFNGPENLATRVFGRLTAWQNWIFQRPNAVGDRGALKVYGKGEKTAFDFNRV